MIFCPSLTFRKKVFQGEKLTLAVQKEEVTTEEGIFVSMFLMPDVRDVVMIPQVIKTFILSIFVSL